eukprot:365469-Chlamydomonas_euryale.AAC.13
MLLLLPQPVASVPACLLVQLSSGMRGSRLACVNLVLHAWVSSCKRESRLACVGLVLHACASSCMSPFDRNLPLTAVSWERPRSGCDPRGRLCSLPQHRSPAVVRMHVARMHVARIHVARMHVARMHAHACSECSAHTCNEFNACVCMHG